MFKYNNPRLKNPHPSAHDQPYNRPYSDPKPNYANTNRPTLALTLPYRNNNPSTSKSHHGHPYPTTIRSAPKTSTSTHTPHPYTHPYTHHPYTHNLTKKQKNYNNKYQLHARSILHQLNQELQLGVLKDQTVSFVKCQLVELLRKCESQVKCCLVFGFVGVCKKLGVGVGLEMFQVIEQAVNYVLVLCNAKSDTKNQCNRSLLPNPKKLYELILVDRLDENLIYIIKNYRKIQKRQQKKHKQTYTQLNKYSTKTSPSLYPYTYTYPYTSALIPKISQIIKKMHEIKQIMYNMMPRQDYNMFMISLNYWNFKYGNNSNHVGEYHLGKGKNKGRHVSKFMNKSRHFNFNQDIDNIELNLCGNQNQQRQNWNGGKVSNNGKSNDNMQFGNMDWNSRILQQRQPLQMETLIQDQNQNQFDMELQMQIPMLKRTQTQQQLQNFNSNRQQQNPNGINTTQKHKSSNNHNQNRNSNMSTNSILSRTSQLSQAYQQRLKRFNQTKQNEQFKRHFKFIQSKKKRTLCRYNSYQQQIFPKRVSNKWTKNQSNLNMSKKSNNGNVSRNQEIIKKSQHHNPQTMMSTNPRNPRVVRKSISIFKRQQQIALNLSIQLNHHSSTNTITQPKFKPFHFYTIIKDNLHILTVQKAQILPQLNKLKIKLSGYFNYSLIFHKFHQNFHKSLQTQKLKKFILTNIQLKQNKIWNILYSKLKIQPEINQNITRNVISQLLPMKEKYRFYCFIKKFNVYFFTKYEADKEKSRFGFLNVYDAYYEDLLQQVWVDGWNYLGNCKRNRELYGGSDGLQKEEQNISEYCFEVNNQQQKNHKQSKSPQNQKPLQNQSTRHNPYSQKFIIQQCNNNIKMRQQNIRIRYQNKNNPKYNNIFSKLSTLKDCYKKNSTQTQTYRNRKQNLNRRKNHNNSNLLTYTVRKGKKYHVLAYVNVKNSQNNFNHNNNDGQLNTDKIDQNNHETDNHTKDASSLHSSLRSNPGINPNKNKINQSSNIICHNLFYEYRYRSLLIQNIKLDNFLRSGSNDRTRILQIPKNKQPPKSNHIKSSKTFHHHIPPKLSQHHQTQTLTILNRRMGTPKYTKIRYQLSFTKKIPDIGYALCKIFIFKPEQSQLILTQIYLPQNQKYYTFSINPSIICYDLLFDLDKDHISGEQLQYIIEMICVVKISGCQTQSGEFGLALTIGDDICIYGAEMLYRECITDELCNPLYIDCIELNNKNRKNKNKKNSNLNNSPLTHTNKQFNTPTQTPTPNKTHNNLSQPQNLQIQRKIHRLSKCLYNQITQHAQMQNQTIYKKYNNYNQFVYELRQELTQVYLFKKPQDLFCKKGNQWFYYFWERCGNGQARRWNHNNAFKDRNQNCYISQNTQNITKFIQEPKKLKFLNYTHQNIQIDPLPPTPTPPNSNTNLKSSSTPFNSSNSSNSFNYPTKRYTEQTFNRQLINQNKIISKLKGKALTKYVHRIIRDPLAYKLFSQELRSKYQCNIGSR